MRLIYLKVLCLLGCTYFFARMTCCQKISATDFAISKIVLYKNARAQNLFLQFIYESLQDNVKKTHTGVISTLLIGEEDKNRLRNYSRFGTRCNNKEGNIKG